MSNQFNASTLHPKPYAHIQSWSPDPTRETPETGTPCGSRFVSGAEFNSTHLVGAEQRLNNEVAL